MNHQATRHHTGNCTNKVQREEKRKQKQKTK
jgi:hypothetical protein